jgi:hypothetical protein
LSAGLEAPGRGSLPRAAGLQPRKALDGGGEPRGIDRLQEVVERVQLEGLHRELVVGGREDDVRHGRLERLEELHPGLPGHLDVEEEEVGLERRHLLAGLLGLRGLARDLWISGNAASRRRSSLRARRSSSTSSAFMSATPAG